VEQVTHESYEVQEHPSAAGQTLDVMGVVAAAAELLNNRLCDAPDVRVGRTGGDDKVVRGLRQPAQIKDHELTALQILNRIHGQTQRLGGPGRHWPSRSCMTKSRSASASAEGRDGRPSST